MNEIILFTLKPICIPERKKHDNRGLFIFVTEMHAEVQIFVIMAGTIIYILVQRTSKRSMRFFKKTI